MVEPEVVRRIEALRRGGLGAKRIAVELGIARNTVRRYLRGGAEARRSERPRGRRLDRGQRQLALELFDGLAEGNAVVVQELLAVQGIVVSLRTLQRSLSSHRRQKVTQTLATVRFETSPGKQMQVDFGQRKVRIGAEVVVVFLLVATLSYSRRLFVQVFHSERRESWLEGIANAFRHFGGVPEALLIDNPRALVVGRDRPTQTVTFDPAFLAFCRDWDVVPKACAPYRARTKGKVESGVKYVKRNALAGRGFASFAELQAHLVTWTDKADGRVHGTTHERPIDRFRRESAALRPLPQRRLVVPRRLRRRVAADCRIDLDTVRYSVPFRLVRQGVEVLVEAERVLVFHDGVQVATHRRSFEPHTEVIEPSHFDGLWRPHEQQRQVAGGVEPAVAIGGRLRDYAAIVEAAR
jgi:transposase